MQQLKEKKLQVMLVTALLLIFAGVAVYLCVRTRSDLTATEEGHQAATVPQYQERLFDTQDTAVIRIDADGEDWAKMADDAGLDGAKDTDAETIVSCDITINGETVENAGIHMTAQRTLAIPALGEATRQDYVVDFGQYGDGKTYEGLDQLVLKSEMDDLTCMKTALFCELCDSMGVPCPLYTYARVIVNGQYQGLYLVMEDMGDSFLAREYGDAAAELCQADSDKVCRAIQYAAEHAGGKLNDVVDVDAMLRYMAAQTLAPCLTGGGAQDDTQDAAVTEAACFICEPDGRIALLPGADIQNFSDAILRNAGYRKQYRSYLEQLCRNIAEDKEMDEAYMAIREDIDDAIEEDSVRYLIYEEYKESADQQMDMIRQRAQDLLEQLDASASCTAEKQIAEMENLLAQDAIAAASADTDLSQVQIRPYIYSYEQLPEDSYGDPVWDGDWAYIEAGGQILARFGCGLCCLTNTYDTLVAEPGGTDIITPATMYEWAKEQAAYYPESGTGALSWQQLKKMCENFGLTARIAGKPADYSVFQQAVAENDVTISLVCKDNDDRLWPYTNGHYICLWDYDAGSDTVYVTDSSGMHNRERVDLADIYRALKTSSKAQYLSVTAQ